MFPSSLTLCNTSFFTRSVYLIFSILPQHHTAKLSRYYLFLKCLGKILIATQKLNTMLLYRATNSFYFPPAPNSPICCTAHINIKLHFVPNFFPNCFFYLFLEIQICSHWPNVNLIVQRNWEWSDGGV